MTPAELQRWRVRHNLHRHHAGEILGRDDETMWRYESGAWPIPATVASVCRVIDEMRAGGRKYTPGPPCGNDHPQRRAKQERLAAQVPAG